MKQHTLKGIILISSIVLSTIFIMKLSYYFDQQRTIPDKTFSIAVISIQLSAHTNLVYQRYKNELLDSSPQNIDWHFHVFDAKKDRLLLQSMIDEVLLGSYDLIYTIGTSASTLTQQYLQKRGHKAPLVFSNILKYVWQDWKKSNPFLGEYATGSYGSYDWPRRIKLMKLILPHVRHAIIPMPSNSSEYSYENIEAMQQELLSQGVESRIIDIEAKSDGIQKLRPFLAATNAMILPREILGLDFTQLILELAHRAQVPTYSADTNSVYAGSTLGLGFDESMPGALAAEQTKQILLDKTPIKNIPATDYNEVASKFLINKNRLDGIGQYVDPRILFLAQRGFVINKARKVPL